MKKLLCEDTVLHTPDFTKPFYLQTGMEAVLSQNGTDGDEHPVGYFSRKLLPCEERYSTVEKELLAIKLAWCTSISNLPSQEALCD